MITPRLEMILRNVTGKSCADIGTDHAYIPIKLAEKGIKVIATDIRPGPLKTAAENVKKHGTDIELRLGGGLTTIKKGEVETVIIAGMGGEMIENIINESIETAKCCTLVLQPMNSQCELRKYLEKNGFKITAEDIAVEGHKIYNLIVAESGTPNKYKDEINYHIPEWLYNHPLLHDLIAKKKREFTKIYNGLCESSENKDSEKKEYESLLKSLNEIERRFLSETE